MARKSGKGAAGEPSPASSEPAQKTGASNSPERVKPAIKEITGDAVLQLFKEAWPDRDRHPDAATCKSVATHINSFVSVRKNHGRGSKPAKRFEERKKKYQFFHKAARAFIQHFADVRHDMQTQADQHLATEYRDGIEIVHRTWAEGHLDRLAQLTDLDRARDAVEAVINSVPIPKEWKTHDEMRWIANGAIDAWSTTGETVPLGIDADEPLNAFVRLALEKIGIFASRETIHDHLRDRVGGGGARKRR